MTDKEFLSWIYDRMIYKYGENENMDYLHRFKRIIDSLQEEPDPQFKVGDTIRSKVWESAVHKIASMDNSAYFFENGGMVEIANQELWELAEDSVSGDLEKVAEEAAVAAFFVSPQWTKTGERLFKAGAQWQKEKMMANATKVTVHIDAGNYPYIPQIELYDYDNDVPLAKDGDKYKVVLIKE